MICKACGWGKSTVIKTDVWPDWRIRTRECCRCKFKWTTYEMAVDNLTLLEAANFISKECSGRFKAFAEEQKQESEKI